MNLSLSLNLGLGCGPCSSVGLSLGHLGFSLGHLGKSPLGLGAGMRLGPGLVREPVPFLVDVLPVCVHSYVGQEVVRGAGGRGAVALPPALALAMP